MINPLLDDMIAHLAPRFPDSVSIARYSGRFTERDLDRFAGRAPALLVSLQSLHLSGCHAIPAPALHAGDRQDAPRRRMQGTITCAIAILTKDRPEQTRDQVAIDLINTLVIALPQQTFDNSISLGVKPDSIHAQNLHSLALDNKAVTLWGLTFEQTVRMETGTVPVFEKPARVMLGIEPEIGPEHIDKYAEVVAEDIEDIKPGGTI